MTTISAALVTVTPSKFKHINVIFTTNTNKCYLKQWFNHRQGTCKLSFSTIGLVQHQDANG